TFFSRDVLTPRDYRLTITAQVVARERSTGRVLLDRKISGYSDIRIGPDLTSSEREALPLIAEDLARNATAALVEGTWGSIMKHPHWFSVWLLLLASCSPLASQGAGDWPQWRGPTRDGHAPPGAPAPTSLPNELKPSWKIAVGAGFSAPIV